MVLHGDHIQQQINDAGISDAGIAEIGGLPGSEQRLRATGAVLELQPDDRELGNLRQRLGESGIQCIQRDTEGGRNHTHRAHEVTSADTVPLLLEPVDGKGDTLIHGTS